jgi:outer membrane immunogenic protein
MVLNENGPIAGGQIGYRFQRDRLVFGVEATWDALVGSRKQVTFAQPGLGVTPNVAQLGSAWRWAMTIDPTVGFLLTPNLMLYGGGGFALAQLDRSITLGSAVQLGNGSGTAGKALAGWNLKVGAEWMFAPGWSAGIEGRYLDFGKKTASITGLGYGDVLNPNAQAVQYVATSRADAFSVLVRVNRQFDFFR